MKVDTVQSCGMEEIMEQGKWTSPSHTKGQFSSKEGDVVYMAGLEGNSLDENYQVSLAAQLVKNLSTMQEALFCLLGREDPLENG